MACSMMKNIIASVLLCLLCANYALAHTYLSSVVVQGQALNEGDCVRPHPQQQKEYPLTSVLAPEMTCGWLPSAANPANRKCPIAAGTQIGLQWWHVSPGDDVIEATHKGSIIVYMAKSENGAGNVWFKIYEDGFDPITRKWASDKLVANRGLVTVTIPSDIAAGNYLLRGELLALHNAYDVGGIQPYVGCVELAVTGSGSATPQGVAFPGAYLPAGTGMLFDVYRYYNSYTIPGPAIYKPSSSQPATATPTTPAPSSTTAPTTSPVTARPTSTPVSPTTPPTTAAPATASPTSAPASPSTAPTYRPPPVAPTTRPTAASTIKFSTNQGSNDWWVGILASGYSETLVKIEIMDGKNLRSWAPLSDMGYAFVFSESIQMTLPLSVRFTSSRGNQVVVNNAITSWSMTAVDTGLNFQSNY